MTNANGKNHQKFKHNLRSQKFANVQVLTLSRRKQGFESPRERQSNQLLVPNRPAAHLSFSNFSPNQIAGHAGPTCFAFSCLRFV